MKKSTKKIVKIVCFSLLASLVLLPVIYSLVRFGMYDSDMDAEPVTDLSAYRKGSTSGWDYDEPDAIFPETSVLTQAEKTNYLYKCVHSPVPLLFDNDVVMYLSCDFGEEAYLEECKRLQALCGASNAEFGYEPAYVYHARGGGFCCEYALKIERLHRIVYVSFQNQSFAEKYIEASCLPKVKYLPVP